MSIYKVGKVWHYDFRHDGKRYKGSSRQTKKNLARQYEAKKREEGGADGPGQLLSMQGAPSGKRRWGVTLQRVGEIGLPARLLTSPRSSCLARMER